MADGRLVLLGVGDVGPVHPPMDRYSALVRETLAAGDIRFGQCERVYSDRGALQLHSGGGHSRLKAEMASVFTDCGFDVVSVASNHGLDWGPDAFMDSVGLLRSKGIATVGGGVDIADARRPAIVEKNGVKVAFLAYCSILNEGYQAGEKKVGLAPLRVNTYYRVRDRQPGLPPQIVTIPFDRDLDAMVADVRAARALAHAVVVSMHWGIHFIPRMIADYQEAVADAAFEAGADLILGHHAHVPKGIDVRRGRVCFHSLSNFIMTAPARSPERNAAFARTYSTTIDPDYPNLPYGADAKRSLVAKAVITTGGVERVSFLPALINPQLQPEILRHGDPRFDDMVRYMEWASEGMNARFGVSGDEVIVSAA